MHRDLYAKKMAEHEARYPEGSAQPINEPNKDQSTEDDSITEQSAGSSE